MSIEFVIYYKYAGSEGVVLYILGIYYLHIDKKIL